MKTIRLVQSEWGGLSYEAVGPLLLYGIPVEVVTMSTRQDLIDICQAAQTESSPTVVLLGEGFVNQFGADLPAALPTETGGLRVLWVKVLPKDGSQARFRTSQEDAIGPMVLEAIGESKDLLNEVESAINATLRPRFDSAILSGVEYYCYDSENDLELHLPVGEVRDHFRAGDLPDWLRGVVREADEANE
jgi:hypothetical protein